MPKPEQPSAGAEPLTLSRNAYQPTLSFDSQDRGPGSDHASIPQLSPKLEKPTMFQPVPSPTREIELEKERKRYHLLQYLQAQEVIREYQEEQFYEREHAKQVRWQRELQRRGRTELRQSQELEPSPAELAEA